MATERDYQLRNIHVTLTYSDDTDFSYDIKVPTGYGREAYDAIVALNPSPPDGQRLESKKVGLIPVVDSPITCMHELNLKVKYNDNSESTKRVKFPVHANLNSGYIEAYLLI